MSRDVALGYFLIELADGNVPSDETRMTQLPSSIHTYGLHIHCPLICIVGMCIRMSASQVPGLSGSDLYALGNREVKSNRSIVASSDSLP